MSSVAGPPSDLDFVMKKDETTYGADVKNWTKSEMETILEVKQKVNTAAQLGLAPFIMACYVDDDRMYREVIQKGGLVYRFWDLLVPSTFSSLATRVRDLLGYPVLATDVLPSAMSAFIVNLHRRKAAELKSI